MNLVDYAHEKVDARVDQIIYLNHAFRGIDETHCRALTQLFCNHTFDYAYGLLIVFFTAANYWAVATHGSTVNDVDGKNVLKDECGVDMINGRNQRLSVKMVTNENRLAWVAESLCMQYAFRIDGSP